MNQFNNTPIHPPIHPSSLHLTILTSINLSIHPSLIQSFHTPSIIHQSIRTSIVPSILYPPSIYLLMHRHAYIDIHPSIQATINSLSSQFHSLLIQPLPGSPAAQELVAATQRRGGETKPEAGGEQAVRQVLFFQTPSWCRQKLISARRCIAAYRRAAT